jgi:intracellular sulfur oxidation DsrE/DsrF family protein
MKEQTTHRRGFITTLLGGAAAFSLSSVLAPAKVQAQNAVPSGVGGESEKWFTQLEGKKHKMVFDMTKHNHGACIGWALTLMDTYNDMEIPDKDLSIIIVLRYAGFGFAFGDPLWKKYGFGKRLELKDDETGKMALRNIYGKCKTEDDDCIELFQKRGGMVAVCGKSIEGSAEGLAKQLKLKKEDVHKEFMDNLLPGIQVVPSGIWALNRSQELGCTFCFGG